MRSAAVPVVVLAILSGLVPAVAQSGPRTMRDVDYDIDSPPAPSPASQNFLDVYSPAGARRGSRPVIVYVHGGGWSIGDKANQITDKVNLFTGLGYVFVSVNYRLSPRDATTFDPGRVRHPDHAHDVGEALGWLDRHVARHGGDPDRIILIGHSAGAHLVSLVGTDPRYTAAYRVATRQLRGVVSLDTDAFDVTEQATPGIGRPRALPLFWNAFGTADENAATGSWRDASPLTWADPTDPPFLLVTSTVPGRLRDNTRMAQALSQPDSVLSVPLSHAGINDAVGAPGDESGVTDAVTGFIERVLPNAAPRASITEHPKRVVAHGHAPRAGDLPLQSEPARFEVPVPDRRSRSYKRCRSPRRYRLRPGRHRFRVRALAEDGTRGRADSFTFRVRRVRR